MTVEREPEFQISVPPSKSFWLRLRLQPSKIAWAPAPQPCLKHYTYKRVTVSLSESIRLILDRVLKSVPRVMLVQRFAVCFKYRRSKYQ